MLIHILGFLAMVLSVGCLVPQIWKSYKDKSVEDLSLMMIILINLNTIIWVIYGILISAVAVYLCNLMMFILSIILLVFKFIYAKK